MSTVDQRFVVPNPRVRLQHPIYDATFAPFRRQSLYDMWMVNRGMLRAKVLPHGMPKDARDD